MGKHGMYQTRIYSIWRSMKSRCQDKNKSNYKNYGGRGINVCDKWQDFIGFYEDMGDPPKGLTLDRIDNDGPYCKENCRWATWEEQHVNKRMRSDNTVGFRGVEALPYGRYRATFRGKHLGVFDTPELASARASQARGVALSA